MGLILFIVVLASLGLVLFWYVRNEEEGAQGSIGLLALDSASLHSRDPNALAGLSYRAKDPRNETAVIDIPAAEQAKTANYADARKGGRYRQRGSGHVTAASQPRYRVRS